MRRITHLLAAALACSCTVASFADNDLACELSLASTAPAVGQPILLTMVLKNNSSKAQTYDDQQAAVNRSLEVVGPAGESVPFIAMTFQTSGGDKRIEPGATAAVFEKLDLAGQYLIDKAGAYTVRFVGRDRLPASNTLTVKIGAGTVPDRTRLLASLLKDAPKGWRAANSGDAIVLLHTPTTLKADACFVSLVIAPTKDKAPDGGEYLGFTTLGHAWATASSPKAAERWPGFAAFLRAQLAPFAKVTQPG